MEADLTLSRPELGIRVFCKHMVDQILISADGAIDAERVNKGVGKPLTGLEVTQSGEQGIGKRLSGDFRYKPNSGLIAQQVHDAS